MTAPTVTPSKWKTWIALAGSALTFVVPLIVSVEDYLPSPWPSVIGGVIAVLTAVGVYKAPYVPPGAVVVADPQVVPAPPVGGYRNPWA